MVEIQTPAYIGIPDHAEVRRDLLLCSRDILFALKAFEASREARAKRIELTFALHKVMDEIGVLSKKIRLKLPRMPPKVMLSGSRESSQIPAMHPAKLSGKKAGKGGKDKLSVLDQEMTRIETRLKKMG